MLLLIFAARLLRRLLVESIVVEKKKLFFSLFSSFSFSSSSSLFKEEEEFKVECTDESAEIFVNGLVLLFLLLLPFEKEEELLKGEKETKEEKA